MSEKPPYRGRAGASGAGRGKAAPKSRRSRLAGAVARPEKPPRPATAKRVARKSGMTIEPAATADEGGSSAGIAPAAPGSGAEKRQAAVTAVAKGPAPADVAAVQDVPDAPAQSAEPRPDAPTAVDGGPDRGATAAQATAEAGGTRRVRRAVARTSAAAAGAGGDPGTVHSGTVSAVTTDGSGLADALGETDSGTDGAQPVAEEPTAGAATAGAALAAATKQASRKAHPGRRRSTRVEPREAAPAISVGASVGQPAPAPTVVGATAVFWRETAGFALRSLEVNAAGLQAMAESRTVAELMQRQRRHAQILVDVWIHQVSRMRDICLAMFQQAPRR